MSESCRKSCATEGCFISLPHPPPPEVDIRTLLPRFNCTLHLPGSVSPVPPNAPQDFRFSRRTIFAAAQAVRATRAAIC
jgi:hypothetical protein